MAPRVLVPLVLLALAGIALAASTDRLVERPLILPNNLMLGKTVPIVDPPKRIAGYFKLDRTYDARMFYFFFQSRSKKADDPIVLWMTGGPGCSSELAVFFENGPYSVNQNMTLSETAYGWDLQHDMIFVDQPINTGFSYSSDDRDRVYGEDGVADDMLDFLQEFFEAHFELADKPFYVTGESYAGHYVPAVSYRVWAAAKRGEGKPINIRGLAIGNGLTDPAIQYGAYADYAYNNKLIGKLSHDIIQLFYPICRFGANFCNTHGWQVACLLSVEFCQATIFGQIMSMNPSINVYDIRKDCEGALCYKQFEILDKFMNLPEVHKALGVDRDWVGCDPGVYMDMMGDWMKSYDIHLPEMLADGVRVMVYAGDQDLICNWLGNRRWVDALPWMGRDGWLQQPEQEWSVGGKAAGSVTEFNGLSFVRVYQAGHMVPMDQPAAALDMISRFTRNQSLVQPGFFDIRPVAQQQVEHRSVQAGAMEQAEQQVQAS